MEDSTIENVTRVLAAVRDGEPGAADQLFPIVYEELRGIAGRLFKSQHVLENTVQPTMLVHDVFLKLTQKSDIGWESRAHFFAVAAIATRELLVSHARRRYAAKRGGDWQRMTLSGIGEDKSAKDMIDVLDLENALSQLGKVAPRQEQIVEMRFYAGMTVEEVAKVLGLSVRTIMYEWRMARAWLQTQLEGGVE